MSSVATYLRVPYAEKAAAKELGAKWDPTERAWYVPEGRDPAVFRRWLGEGAPASIEEFAPPLVEAADATDALSLGVYMSNAQAIVRRHLSAKVWVAAEIAEGALRGAHLYLTLAETDASGGVLAQARAVAFSATHRDWFREFIATVGQAPAAGMKVLVQVSAELSSRYGFQLQIHSIDPSYTLGEFARKMAQIRRQLETEGVLRAQERLPAPVDFTRVVVISPPVAAGLGDFRRDAAQLEELGLTHFTYVASAFQGVETEAQLLAALERVEALHAQRPFDACIVLRGGGSQLDLDWLNSLPVARAITQASLPVFTAIGHERDRVVLDEVSQCSFDTPSKAIAHIRSTVRDRAVAAERDLMRIEKAVAARIDRAQSRVDAQWERTRVGSTRWIGLALGRMQTGYVRVSESARGRLQRAGEGTERLFNRAGQRASQRLATLAANVAALDRQGVHAARLAQQRTSSSIEQLVQRISATSSRRLDRAAHAVSRVFDASTTAARRRTDTLERGVERTFEASMAVARRRTDALQRAVERTWHAVDRADPGRILGRGFVLVQQDGHTVTHAAAAEGDVTLRWADGTRTARINPTHAAPPPANTENEQ